MAPPPASCTYVCTYVQTRLMVEGGQATIDFRDRWSNTALDEAKRVGAADVVAYLEQRMPKAEVGWLPVRGMHEAPVGVGGVEAGGL